MLACHAFELLHQPRGDALLAMVAMDDQALDFRSVPPVLLRGKYELDRPDDGVIVVGGEDDAPAVRSFTQALEPIRLCEVLVERSHEAHRRAIVHSVAKENDQIAKRTCAPVGVWQQPLKSHRHGCGMLLRLSRLQTVIAECRRASASALPLADGGAALLFHRVDLLGRGKDGILVRAG